MFIDSQIKLKNKESACAGCFIRVLIYNYIVHYFTSSYQSDYRKIKIFEIEPWIKQKCIQGPLLKHSRTYIKQRQLSVKKKTIQFLSEHQLIHSCSIY